MCLLLCLITQASQLSILKELIDIMLLDIRQGICVSVGGDKSATVSFPIAFTKFQRHVLGDNLDEIASWGCSGSIGDLKSIRLWSVHYTRYITVVAIGI